MESLIKTKQAEREKHLLEKHKDDAIRAGMDRGGENKLLDGALVALRGRPSKMSGEFKKGDPYFHTMRTLLAALVLASLAGAKVN